MRARIRLFGLIDQNASESWLDTCGWLISFQRSVSEAHFAPLWCSVAMGSKAPF
jgi:hypothetical protein